MYGKDNMAKACSMHVRKKPEEKRTLGRLRHSWKNDINVNFLKEWDWRMWQDQCWVIVNLRAP
jgi:hypothetical protein